MKDPAGKDLLNEITFRLNLPDIKKNISERLNDEINKWIIEFHPTIGSTQTRAKELGKTSTERALVIAGLQTEGRGRLNRQWESQPGRGLYFSIMFRPQIAPSDLPLLSIAAALGVETAVLEAAGISLALKWPNDLLLNERKVCGILSESVFYGAAPAFCVTGIGLNLLKPVDITPELSERVDGIFISQPENYIENHTIEKLLIDVTVNFLKQVRSLETGGKEALLTAYSSVCSSVGRKILVEADGKTTEGICCGIGSDGELLLQTADGIKSFNAADVTHAKMPSVH